MLNSELNKLSKENEIKQSPAVIWSRLSLAERKHLRWLVFSADKERIKTDEAGVVLFGPYTYHRSLYNLMKSNCLILMAGKQNSFYVIPREMDHFIVEAEAGNSDRNTIDKVWFHLSLFQTYFLLFCNWKVQGPSTFIQELDENSFEELNSFFSSIIPETGDQAAALLWKLENCLDDLMEEYALKYIQDKTTVDISDAKRLLYGDGLVINHTNLEMSLFFKTEQCKTTLLNLKEHSSLIGGATSLQQRNWLFPLETNPAFLLKALIFSEVMSVGQMIHLEFTEKSVLNGKDALGNAEELWQDLLDLMPIANTELEELESIWTISNPIEKTGPFFYYSVSSPPLLRLLSKEAAVQCGKVNVISVEQGIFISEDKQKKWEEYLQSLNMSYVHKENEKEKIKNCEVTFSIADYRGILLKEWEDVQRLPSVSFQLMQYKENMKARLIRQSQALKLPVMIEEDDNRKKIVEVKSLQFHSENTVVETYDGLLIPLNNITRLALINPQKTENYS